jgi:pyrroline-5-carboxylate reductase
MVLGFAGSGNMAAAMARGWALGADGPDAMLFTDSGSGRAQALADELGGERCDSLPELAERADAIVLAVKPHGLADVAPALASTRLIASVLGATTTESLASAFPEAVVVRTMPNVAVELRRGVICTAPATDPAAAEPMIELLRLLGTVVELPEDRIDAATAVMGCAPAYIARAAGAISAAGAEAGLADELSRTLVAEAIEGLGALLASHDAEALQTAIASPGGSTEAGLDVLTERDAAGIFREAVVASLERMEGKR